jgi:hypothetical protein
MLFFAGRQLPDDQRIKFRDAMVGINFNVARSNRYQFGKSTKPPTAHLRLLSRCGESWEVQR